MKGQRVRWPRGGAAITDAENWGEKKIPVGGSVDEQLEVVGPPLPWLNNKYEERGLRPREWSQMR